jgi:hypothetical protein
MTKRQHDQILNERDAYSALIPSILASAHLATLVEASRRFSFHTAWKGNGVGTAQYAQFSSAMKPFTRAVGYMTPAQRSAYRLLWKDRLLDIKTLDLCNLTAKAEATL